MITGILIWTMLILLMGLLVWAIISGRMSGSGGNFAATSVFSDMQNEEKRNAMETVIEEKQGSKRFEQETEDTNKQ